MMMTINKTEYTLSDAQLDWVVGGNKNNDDDM